MSRSQRICAVGYVVRTFSIPMLLIKFDEKQSGLEDWFFLHLSGNGSVTITT